MDKNNRFSACLNEYNQLFSDGKVRRQIGFFKLEMTVKGLNSFLGLVTMRLKEKKKPLLVKVISVILNLVFGHVFMKLMNLFSLIFVVLNLPVVEETAPFFALFGLLLFF